MKINLPDYLNTNSEIRTISSSIREDEVVVIDQLTKTMDKLGGNRALYSSLRATRSGTIRIMLRYAMTHYEDMLRWYRKETR